MKTKRFAGRSTALALLLGVGLGPASVLATLPDWEAVFGTPTGLGDDGCHMASIGFPFTFYGTAYSSVNVNANGNLSLNGCFWEYNPTWPRPGYAFIAPLWGDLDPGTNGEVYFRTTGAAPNRVFVATWHQVPEYGDAVTSHNTFQVKLFEGTNRIQLGYNGLATDGFTGSDEVHVGINGPSGGSVLVAKGAAVPGLDQTNVCFIPEGTGYTVRNGACTVSQDRSAPAVRFMPELPAFVNERSLTVAGVASDDQQVTQTQLRLNGALVTSIAGDTLSGTVTFPAEGSHTVVLEAVDVAGNRGDTSATVVYDATSPAVQLAALPPLTRDANVTVTGTVADASGVEQAHFVLNGDVFPASISDGTVTAVLPLSEGPNSLSLVALDRAGNTGAATASIELDTRSPQVSIVSPAAGQVVGTSDLSLVLAVSDASAVTATVDGRTQAADAGTQQLVLPVTIPSEGTHTFTVAVQDAAGNPATVVAVSVLLDLSAPILTLTRTDGMPLQDGDRFGPLAGDGLAVNVRLDDLSAAQVDFAHGTSYTAPRGGLLISELVPLTEGSNLVEVSATDEVGRSTVLRRTVVYDVTAPQGAVTVPAVGAAVRGTVDLSAQAEDNLTGVVAVAFRVDGGEVLSGAPGEGGNWSATLDTTLLADGAHTLTATLTDGVGNTSAVSQAFDVDNTVPSVSLAPLDSHVREVITLAADASDLASGVTEVTLSVEGTPVHTCTGEALTRCETQFDTRTLPNGPFVVTATASDRAGNAAAPSQQRLVANNVAPQRFLVSPSSSTIVTESMDVVVQVEEPDFAEVECWVDGTSLGKSTNPAFSTRVDTRGMLDGPSQVRCEAADMAGNVGVETATVQVRNWTYSLDPRTLNLRSSGQAVTLLVEGVNVSLLVPTDAHDLALRIAGGPRVPVLAQKASDTVGDRDRDGVPDVALKFDRRALTASIRAGIASGSIAPGQPLTVVLLAGTRELGSETLTMKH